MEFRSSQQIWRVDRKIITSHSSYLNFLSYTAPRDLKFGYVVVHKLRNNFNEESMLIWARENRVSKLTTNLTGWQTNDKQSLIIPGFLELYCSEGPQIWICCSSQVKEQLQWRKYVEMNKKKWSLEAHNKSDGLTENWWTVTHHTWISGVVLLRWISNLEML